MSATHFLRDHGPALAAAGFRLVPVAPPDAPASKQWAEYAAADEKARKNLNGFLKTRGKAPSTFVGDGWRGMRDWASRGVADAGDIKRWSDWPPCGVGFIAGQQRDAYVIAIDVDVLDEGAAAAIDAACERMLGSAPKRIGQAPKFMRLYRSSDTLSIKASKAFLFSSDPEGCPGHRVEIRGEGAHCVLAGVHPKTGGAYAWDAGLDAIAPDRLPIVTPAQVSAFVEEAERILRAHGGEERGRRSYAGGGESGSDAPCDPARLRARGDLCAEVFRRFIANDELPYDEWVRVGYALKGAYGEDEGRALWAEWSAAAGKDVPEYTEAVWSGLKNPRTGAADLLKIARERDQAASAFDAMHAFPLDIEAMARLPLAELSADPEWLALARDIDRGAFGAVEMMREAYHGPERIDLAALADLQRERKPIGLVVDEAVRALAVSGASENREAAPDGKARSRGLHFTFAGDVVLDPAPAYLVRGLLDRQATAVVYGAPNSGKTFLVMDMAGHIAAGKPWAGRNVRQALVIYIAAEAGAGAKKRVLALKQRLGVDAFPLALVPCPVDLSRSGGDLEPLIRLVKDAERDAAASGLDCGLIVIDTLSRALAGGDENASTDMGAFIRNIDRLRDETAAAILIVHHSGKDSTKGARGWSGLKGSVDTEIEVREEGERRLASVLKQRDDAKAAPIGFVLDPVIVGTDSEGTPITTCIVGFRGDPGSAFPALPEEGPEDQIQSEAGRSAWRAVLSAAEKTGGVVTKRQWAAAFYDVNWDVGVAPPPVSEMSDSGRRFQRGCREVVGLGLVKEVKKNQYVAGKVRQLRHHSDITPTSPREHSDNSDKSLWACRSVGVGVGAEIEAAA